MAGFLGMRGTGDWVTDQRPKNWRESILYLYPNGMAPLTGLLSKMGNEKVDDPQYYWWTKQLATQSASITANQIWTDIALATAYLTTYPAAGAAAGVTVYVQMTEANAQQFRVGHQVLLRDASNYTVDVNGKVTAVVYNGASSYLAVYLLEADDNGTVYATGNLGTCDVVLINGNINSEGASMPEAISYDPLKWNNYTQIFRTPLEITRTARLTRLRTGDAYKELKREALELHSIEMEKAFMWGIATENTGANGKPERTTMGLVPAVNGAGTPAGGTSGTINDFSLNLDYSGQTWLAGGEEWLDEQLEVMFRYGQRDKLAFVGSGALLGINRLVKNVGQFNFNPSTKAYGIKVVEWTTPFGMINLITHPLFSYDATTRNSMVIFEPKNLKYRFITDTTFYSEKEKQNTGWTRTDGTKEEFLTECGLEYHHPAGWGYLNGVGDDNIV
jgi:hypothetical protein